MAGTACHFETAWFEDPTTRPPAESSGVSPEPKQAPGSAFGSLGLDRVSSLLPLSSPPAAEEEWT